MVNRIGGIDVWAAPAQTICTMRGGRGPVAHRSGTQTVGRVFRGTCNPMVISWPGRIEHDAETRDQFHHVVDIAPTIYDLLDIPLPEVVNGYPQMEMDGVSLAYTFDDAGAASQKTEHFRQ